MAVGRRNSGTQFHTAHTPFFLAPMERHGPQPRITENTMHLGRRHKSGKPIRVAQLPPDFSHLLIETDF
jgi:hypothetical protein